MGWGRSQTHGFNPTLVRLRLKCPVCSLVYTLLFQSHAGSIEALLALVRAIRHLCFNPTLVRLRLPVLRQH